MSSYWKHIRNLN